MSAAHTPGPWKVSPTDWEDCYAGIYSEEANSYLAVIVGTPCSDGDTRLIAAAPDLLAALEAMHACHRAFSSSENWTALDDEARLLAEKAIAKARGEE